MTWENVYGFKILGNLMIVFHDLCNYEDPSKIFHDYKEVISK